MRYLTTSALVSLAASFATAQTPAWPQFRGPNASGIAPDQHPPIEFGPGKNLRWKVEVPPGASSPCIVGDRIFLTGFDKGKLVTFCLNRADGKTLWSADAPADKIEEFHPSEGSPAASTPVSDGERVVVYFGSCGLVSYSLDGKELWKFTLPVAETNNRFGSGTSPILADGMVLLVRDLIKDSAVYAVDVKTGSQAWKTERPGTPTSWSSPIVWKHDGRSELVVPGSLKLKAYDVKTGEERWLVRGLPSVTCTTAVTDGTNLIFAGWSPGGEDFPMPTFDDMLKLCDDDKDGKISKKESQKTFLKDFFDNNDTNKDGFITRDEWDAQIKFLKTGENSAISIRPGGKGDVTTTHVTWRQTKTKGLPYVASPLLYEGRLYMVKDGGLATCLDAKTGKVLYGPERLGANGSYYASPVSAGENIYITSLEGVVVVIKAGDKLKVVARNKLGEVVKATPAIVGDTLYIRGAKTMYAFGSDK